MTSRIQMAKKLWWFWGTLIMCIPLISCSIWLQCHRWGFRQLFMRYLAVCQKAIAYFSDSTSHYSHHGWLLSLTVASCVWLIARNTWIPLKLEYLLQNYLSRGLLPGLAVCNEYPPPYTICHTTSLHHRNVERDQKFLENVGYWSHLHLWRYVLCETHDITSTT